MQSLVISMTIQLKAIEKKQDLKKNKFENIYIKLITNHIKVLVLKIKVHQNFHYINQKQIIRFRNYLILQGRKNNTSTLNIHYSAKYFNYIK